MTGVEGLRTNGEYVAVIAKCCTKGERREIEEIEERFSAVFESTGTVVTQITGATSDFVLEAERQLTYADGTSRLEGVTITVERDDGRDFVITGRQAEVSETGTQVVITGDVRVRVSDGLVITTEQAAYDDLSGAIATPAFVEFSRGRLHGSGMGAAVRARQVPCLPPHLLVCTVFLNRRGGSY